MAGGLVVFLAGIAAAVDWMQYPPRELARYLERRAAGHNRLIVATAGWFAQTMTALDRGNRHIAVVPAMRAGVQPAAVPAREHETAVGRAIQVSDSLALINAVAEALPGDVITLLPGRYAIAGRPYVAVDRAGTQTSRITLRAEEPSTVHVDFDALEGFRVSAPYWTFENLSLRGVCPVHEDCEHAFHVVGKAIGFSARNNTITDFNSQFKINGEDGSFPDNGVIEFNTLRNTSIRQTTTSVTPIDIVGVSNWRVHHNLISDFVKGQGDLTSYGAFVKGGGAGNRLEQNVVACEAALRSSPGQRVGLSIGGGGTASRYCRDKQCIAEQFGGVIQSNLILSCSDDGIYVNRSAGSRIRHNTLIDTGGIQVRFAASSAEVEGNLVDGVIRSRDDSTVTEDQNLKTSAVELFLGVHPVRRLYADAAAMPLEWRRGPPRREGAVTEPVIDLCAPARPSPPALGAFEDFRACLR